MVTQITDHSTVCSKGSRAKSSKLSITGPLCWESIGQIWMPSTKGQWCRRCVHVMTSSWIKSYFRCCPARLELQTLSSRHIRFSSELREHHRGGWYRVYRNQNISFTDFLIFLPTTIQGIQCDIRSNRWGCLNLWYFRDFCLDCLWRFSLDHFTDFKRHDPAFLEAAFNPLCAKLFRGNINIYMYLHFMSLVHSDMTQIAETFPRVRQGPIFST